MFVRMAVVLSPAVLACASAAAQLIQNTPQAPHPAVVRVIAAEPGGASLGSGTLVDVNDEHGLVITNWHVVRDAPGSVIVLFPDGFQSLGKVLRMDANWDLAAILIDKPKAAPVTVARQAPQIGDTLSIAGYGSGAYRLVAGPCTQYLAPGLRQPQELIELAARARQGDSGGPIFNSQGELAGVLFGEGGGRTTGAYCGRVHSFLAAAVQQLYPADSSVLASRTAAGPNSQHASVSPASDVRKSSAGQGESIAAAEAAKPDRSFAGWEDAAPAPREAIAGRASDAVDRSPESVASDVPTKSNATFPAYADGPTAVNPVAVRVEHNAGTPPERNPPQPVAAISAYSDHATAESAAAPVTTFERQPSSAIDNASQHATTEPQPSSDSTIDWREFFGGETLAAQVKTVLACVGLAALAYHGLRISMSGGSKTAPRGKGSKRATAESKTK
jgi:hypothetical protein